MALPDYPITRNEQYLNNIATGSGELPEFPLSREEQYLAYIAEHGGGGGGGNVPDPTAADIGKVVGAVADGTGVKLAYVEGGSGMSAETYDPDGAVADAGGIPAYVADNAPVTSVNGKTGDVELVPSDLGIGTVFQLKGSKATVADLPASGNTIGDVWYVTAESVGYIWLNDGTTDRWEQLGLPVDLSNYYTKTETDAAIESAIGAAIGGAY